FLQRMNLLTWSHLWFLGYLLLISIMALPLLVRLAARVPSTLLPPRSWVYAPAVPIAILLVFFKGYWPFLPNLYSDVTNFPYFALCFVIGAVLAAWPGFEACLATEASCLGVLGMVAFCGVVLCGESAMGRLFVALTAWNCTGAALGYAVRQPPAPSKL